MGKCPKNLTRIPEGARFCPQCGANMMAAEVVCQGQETHAAPKAGKKAAKKVSASAPANAALNKNQTLSLLSVTLVAIVVTGIFYYVGFQKPLEGKRTAQSTNPHEGHNHPENQAQQDTRLASPSGPEAMAAVGPTAEDLDALKAHYEEDPEDPHRNVEMGNALFDAQRFEEAIPYYEKSLTKAPNDPDVIVDLGVCYFNMGDFDRARTDFLKALDIDAQHVNALYNMGVVAVRQGNIDELIQHWGVLQQVAPQSPQAQRAAQILEQLHQGQGNNPGQG